MKQINSNIILSLTIILMIVGIASANIIIVDDSGRADYTTIGAAISAANAGDIILVNSGFYSESPIIKKQLILKGVKSEGTKPVINARGYGIGLQIYNINGVTFDGFEIINAINIGLDVSQANNNKIRNNTIKYNGYGSSWGGSGLNLWNSRNNEIIGNIAEQNNGTGISFSGGSSKYNTLKNNFIRYNGRAGVGVWDGNNNNTIISNIIHSNRVGINIWNPILRDGYNIVHKNTIYKNEGPGISIGNSSRNNISNNDIRDGKSAGIQIGQNSNNNIIDKNILVNDTSCGIVACHNSGNIITNNIAEKNSIGIFLGDSSNNIMRNNAANLNNKPLLSGPPFRSPNESLGGIYLWKSNNNVIAKNKVSDNPNYGIFVNSSKNNRIYDNIFNNKNNTKLYNSIYNKWNISKTKGINIVGGPYIGGNFWAFLNGTGFSQKCKDNNIDGICDSRYIINIQNIDYLPLKDIRPPASLTELKNITYKRTYINWTWKDPKDSDFSKVMVYINGIFKKNVSNGIRYYNSTHLIPNTYYRISTHTVDYADNINKTWVNKTARTSQ